MPPRKKIESTNVDRPLNPGRPPRRRGENKFPIWEAAVNVGMGLTFSSISAAIQQYSLGNFQAIGQVYENLFREESLRLAVKKRIDALLSCPINIIPASDEPNDVEFAEHVKEHWQTALPRQTITELFRQYLLLETCVGTIAWADGIPTVYSLHPGWLWNSPSSYKWFYQTYDTGRPTIQLNEPDEGVIDSMWNDTVKPIKTPLTGESEAQWVFYSNWHRGYMGSPVCSLAPLIFHKQVTLSKWVEAAKNFSGPLQKVYVPESDDQEKKDAFWLSYLANMENKVVRLERGKPSIGDKDSTSYDVEITSMAGTINVDLYKEFIAWYERKVQIAFLHGNLSTEVAESGGNRAASETHLRVEKQLIVNDDAWFNEFIRTQVLRKWAEEWSLGSIIPRLPTIQHDFSAISDPGERLDSLNKFATVIKSLAEVGYELEEVETLAAQSGIKIKKTLKKV